MDPLFNKAVKASIIFHAVLIAALAANQFLRTLFTPEKKAGIVTFIDTRISGGGGQQEAKSSKQNQPKTKAAAKKKEPEVKKVAQKEEPEPPKETAKTQPDIPTKKNKIEKSKVKITRSHFQQQTGQQTETAAPAKKTAPPMSAGEIKNLLGTAATVSSSAPGPGDGGSSAGNIDDLPGWYYAAVRQAMYNAWDQPSRLSIPPGRVTSVRVRISPDGRILKRDLVIPSGIAALDDSVMQAVSSVKQLKALPSSFRGSYKEITIDFELSGKNI